MDELGEPGRLEKRGRKMGRLVQILGVLGICREEGHIYMCTYRA